MLRFILAVTVATLLAMTAWAQFPLLWEYTQSYPGWDDPGRLSRSSDGGYVVGFATGDDVAFQLPTLLKVDAAGDPVFSRIYSENLPGGTIGAVLEMSGTTPGYLVAGDRVTDEHDSPFLLRTDLAGEPLWIHSYRDTFYTWDVFDLQPAAGGYALLTGRSGPGGRVPQLLRVDSAGNALGATVYGWVNGTCESPSLNVLAGGGFLIGAWVLPSSASGYALLIRTNAEGDTLWTWRSSDSVEVFLKNQLLLDDGSIVLLTQRRSVTENPIQSQLTKLNADRQTVWERTVATDSDSTGWWLQSLCRVPGGFAVAGGGWSMTGTQDWDYALAIYDDDGNPLCLPVLYPQNDEQNVRDLVANPDGGLTILGYRIYDSGEDSVDISVVRFGPNVVNGAREPSVPLPRQLTLGVYPNPFNARTELAYALPQPGAVRLVIVNTLGQRVATLVDGPQAAGAHRVAFDGAGLATGIYFARLEAGGEVQTRKLMLLK